MQLHHYIDSDSDLVNRLDLKPQAHLVFEQREVPVMPRFNPGSSELWGIFVDVGPLRRRRRCRSRGSEEAAWRAERARHRASGALRLRLRRLRFAV